MLALLLPLLGPVMEGLSRLIPDPEARAKAVAEAQAQLITALSASDASQMTVNAAEAANPSVFVAGWRPGAGWICVAGLFYDLLLRPLLPWIATATGHPVPPLPELGDSLWGLLTGMLGLGTLRSFDKARGVDTSTVRPTQPGARR